MNILGGLVNDSLPIELIPVSIALLDNSGILVMVNNQCARILGYPNEELVSTSLFDFILTDDYSAFRHWLSSVFEVRDRPEAEFRVKRSDGTVVFLKIAAKCDSSGENRSSVVNCVLWDITEQKIDEIRHKANELKFEGLLRSMPDAMAIANPNGVIVHVNDQMAKTFGYKEDQLIGQNVEILIPDRFRHGHVHQRQGYMANPKPRQMGLGLELHAMNRNGEEFPVEISLNHQEIEGEKFVWIAIRDISDRKKVEESLRESNERFLSSFKYASIGMALVSTEGKWIKVNKSVCRIVGYSEEELMKMTFQDITYPDDLDIDLDNVQKMLRQEIRSYQIEKRYIHKDGSIVWVLLSVSLVHSEDNKPLYFISQIQDITLWKLSQNLLKESEERFRLAAAGTGLGVWEWKSKPGDDFVSDTFCELIGYSREDFEGRLSMVFNYIHPDFREVVQTNFLRHLSAKESFLSEFLLKKKSGEYAWFEITGQAHFNKEGRATRTVGYLIDVTQRKQAVDRFKVLLNSSPDGIFMVDKDFCLTMINKPLEQMIGREEKEIVGQPITLFIPDFKEKIDAQKRRKQGKTRNDISNKFFDSFVIQKSGSRVPVELAVNNLPVGDDLTVIATVRDISERLAVDNERKRILAALNITTDGIFMFNPETLKHVYVNNGAIRQVGYSENELLNMTPLDFKIEFTEESFRNMLEPLLNNERDSITFETIHKHKSGKIVQVEVIFQLSTTTDTGKIVVAVVRDISERKLAEEALHLSEERFRELYENSTFGIYRTTRSGRIILANPALIKLLGFDSIEDLQSRDLTSYGYAENQSRNEFIAQIELEGKVADVESVWLKKDGTPIFVRESSKLIIDKYTGEHFYDGTVEDITVKKQAETDRIARQVAEAANKAKSIFLANMSHEIRTPLNSIIGFSELLSNSLKDPKSRSQAESIRISGRNLLRIINDILDLSKIEAGKLVLQPEPVDIFKFLNEMENIFLPLAKEKGISFFTEIEKEISHALVLDETRLRQILFNLVGNAIKFTHEGNVILSIDLRNRTENLVDFVLSVEDTGIGIPKEQQELIFEPFTQQEGQLEKKYGGTGLGLSITQRLVHMMNGKITLTSHVGTGSTFTVILPDIKISGEEVIQMNDQSFDPTLIRFEKAKILVVDDNKENRKLLRDYLEYSPLEILEADDGSVAIELARLTMPDLILMDLRMPGMNGVDAAGILKAEPLTAQIPIVAVSASSKIIYKERINSEVFNDFLVKPVVLRDLTEILKKYLTFSDISGEISNSGETFETEYLLDEQQKMRLKILVGRLEDEFIPSGLAVLRRQEINNMEVFGKDLIRLGEEYKYNLLVEYGESICLFSDNFEIDKLMKKLQEFPVFVSKLKKILR